MILCVTLNPSWDVTHVSPGWQAGGVVRAARSYAFAAGKGINVARGLRDLGHETLSLALVGGTPGDCVRSAIQLESLPASWIAVAGDTRTNLTVRDPATGHELHSVGAGPHIDRPTWQRVREAFQRAADRAAYVVLAGSLPPGAPSNAYAEMTELARACGVPTLVDTSGAALEQAVRARPAAIKPNRDELAELCGRTLGDRAAVMAAARELAARGIGLVAATLGAEGAVAATADSAAEAAALAVPVANTVGCGDAFVAGLVHGLIQGMPLDEQLRWATAAASANVTVDAPGAVPALVAELLPRVRVGLTDAGAA